MNSKLVREMKKDRTVVGLSALIDYLAEHGQDTKKLARERNLLILLEKAFSLRENTKAEITLAPEVVAYIKKGKIQVKVVICVNDVECISLGARVTNKDLLGSVRNWLNWCAVKVNRYKSYDIDLDSFSGRWLAKVDFAIAALNPENP